MPEERYEDPRISLSSGIKQGRIQEFEKGGAQLPLLLPSPPLPSLLSPSLRSRPPLIQLRGLGERCKLPQRGPGQSPGRKSNFGVFGAQERHLMARI